MSDQYFEEENEEEMEEEEVSQSSNSSLVFISHPTVRAHFGLWVRKQDESVREWGIVN